MSLPLTSNKCFSKATYFLLISREISCSILVDFTLEEGHFIIPRLPIKASVENYIG